MKKIGLKIIIICFVIGCLVGCMKKKETPVSVEPTVSAVQIPAQAEAVPTVVPTMEPTPIPEPTDVPADDKEVVKSKKIKIKLEPDYGQIYVKFTPEDMDDLGIFLGDSIDAVFSNGYELRDIPYFDGYYVRNGMPLLCYDEDISDYLVFMKSNTGTLIKDSGITKDDTVVISLHEAEKYSDIQAIFECEYEDMRGSIETAEEYANFRMVSCGDIKEGILYRGSSPVNDVHWRAECSGSLVEENGINFILDLADTQERFLSFDSDYDRAYVNSLYEQNRIAFLGITSAFSDADFQRKLAPGLRMMMVNEGPYFVHCTEGKDRTGFVCCLLEALCGATYEEMKEDYMLTYYNYYGYTMEDDEDVCNVIIGLRFNEFIEYIAGTNDLEKLKVMDYTEPAIQYLRNCGMNDQEIAYLRMKLIN